MGTVRKKLSSNSGASFVIALLLMLICAMVAAVILTSASMNVSTTDKQRVEQQAYLALSSAAEVLKSDLENMGDFEVTGSSGTKTYTCVNIGCVIHNSSNKSSAYTFSPSYKGPNETKAANVPESILGNYVGDMAEPIYKGLASSGSDSFVISADGMPEVTAQLSMTADYKLTIVLTVASGDYSYSVTMTASSTRSSDTRTVMTGSDTFRKYGNRWYLVTNSGIGGTRKTCTYEISADVDSVSWNFSGIKQGAQ